MTTEFKIGTRSLMIAMIVLMTLIIAEAQNGRPQGPPPIPNDEQVEKMVSDLSEELALNQTQSVQVSKLFTTHFDDARNRLEKNKPSREMSREEMEQQKRNFEKEVKTLLTKEQQTQFDAFLRNHDPRKAGQQRP